jgi:6-pyruvoyltetrahydropterin/6-carboxytetrahydropterin synthase
MHGHTYRVDLVFRGDLDERGFVLDFSEIADLWQPIHDAVDHRMLNDVPGLENPTCEVLAGWIARHADHPNLVAVRVWESSTTWAEVEL